MSLVEHGACHGDTTKIFSSIFKNVYAYDWAQENVDRIKKKCTSCDNVKVTVMDVVKDEWKFPDAQEGLRTPPKGGSPPVEQQ